jgi:hypothetical protein
MDMMAMMKAVTRTSKVLFEDFASRSVILGGMVGSLNDRNEN